MNELITSLNDHMVRHIEQMPAFDRCGRVSCINGLVIEVTGLVLPMGHICRIHLGQHKTASAEVIAFSKNSVSIMPYDHCTGIAKGMLVSAMNGSGFAKVGLGLLGRVVDGLGRPIDGKGEVVMEAVVPFHPEPINPLMRRRITKTLDVGVRAINGLMTICKGQRMGIFAEAGLGKSVLLGMMTKFAEADIVVVGLIGERGREVKEFIEEIIGEAGLKKTIVVAAPADNSPLMKVTGANYATAIAEYFRDLGKDVLLIVDSITRYAQAYRQMSLSGGEMPTAKGYTPSVFSKLSSLIERSGNGSDETGSITAFYTVLTDSEEMNDPIAEHVRSLIDGHIILSRDLAEEGHFPAINVEKSISRLMHAVVDEPHHKLTIQLKRLIHAYAKNKDMINIGMYQSGSDPLVDAALSHWEVIRRYLTQGMEECARMEESLILLQQIIKSTGLST
jgi:flagellum-specific ATP synthase